MKKIKIIIDSHLGNHKCDALRGYACLDLDEKNRVWAFISSVLKESKMPGKNKPSYVYDAWNSMTKKKEFFLISNANGLTFQKKNVWHYHFETINEPYRVSQLGIKETNPVLRCNFKGKTCRNFLHYKRFENQEEVVIVILGVGPHEQWEVLASLI